MVDMNFKSSFPIEEIENYFKNANFFSGTMDGLGEALACSKGKAAADNFTQKCSLLNEHVSEIRTALQIPQRAFVEVLGVSCRTLEAWEQWKIHAYAYSGETDVFDSGGSFFGIEVICLITLVKIHNSWK